MAEAHQLAIESLKKQQEELRKTKEFNELQEKIRKMSEAVDKGYRDFRDNLKEGKYIDPDSVPDTGHIA